MVDFSMAKNCPDTAHQIVLFFYIIIVSFLNLLLLYFIRNKTSETMREYKRILYFTSVIDFISAWSQYLIGIRVSLENDMQTFNFDGPLPRLIGDWTIFTGGRLQFLAMLETFSTAFSFAFGIIPFMYRYSSVCWNYYLSTGQLILLTCLTGLLAFWSSLSYAIMSNSFFEQNSPGILQNPNCLRSLGSWTSAQAETNLYGAATYWMVRGWFYGLLGILYSYIIPVFCAWRVFINLKRQSFMFVTKKSKSMQRQLNATIALQAISPLIVTGFSLVFLYVGIKTEFKKELSFIVLFNSFLIFPILNPAISLFFISTYRKSFIDFVLWIFGKNMIYGGWRRNATFASSIAAVTPDNRSMNDGHKVVPLRSSQVSIMRPSTAASFVQVAKP